MTDNFDRIKIERTKDMPQLKREIILKLFDFVSRRKHGQWWKYTGEFIYQGTTYNLECECTYDNQIFTYRNLYIEHKQEVIDVDELVRQGIITND